MKVAAMVHERSTNISYRSAARTSQSLPEMRFRGLPCSSALQIAPLQLS